MDERFLDITSSLRIPVAEIEFRTSRSSGPGGQNVNKLETRIELLFDAAHSQSLNPEQRARIIEKLSASINADGVLRITSQESRSQWQNKQRALEKLTAILRSALKKQPKRIRTKATRTSHEQRLQHKKKRSAIKSLRRTRDLGD